jgi:two-component system LytT family response regulator
LDLFTRIPIVSKVVFVTAFDQYAVRAFEVNALDYLLKPVSKKRFASTMNRVYKESKDARNNPQCFEYNDVIFLHASTMKFTKIRNIKLITAEGDYSRIWIHNEKDEMLLRSLKAWEAILPAKFFFVFTDQPSSILNTSKRLKRRPATGFWFISPTSTNRSL